MDRRWLLLALAVPASAALAFACVGVCGITAAGDVKCWGVNKFGELGVQPGAANQTCAGGNPCLSDPVAVALPQVKAKKVAAAVNASYVLTPEGKIFAWGMNHRGQLGHLPRTTENACTEKCNPTPEEVVIP